MAGEWIKMRCDLPDDPAVITMARELGVQEDVIVGKLHRLWSWASKQLRDGYASGVTETWIDRHVGAPGFAGALVAVGWLEILPTGVMIPDFDTHMSQSAKSRALTNNRMQKRREMCGKSDATNVTTASPEKRREEKRRIVLSRCAATGKPFEVDQIAYPVETTHPLYSAFRDALRDHESICWEQHAKFSVTQEQSQLAALSQSGEPPERILAIITKANEIGSKYLRASHLQERKPAVGSEVLPPGCTRLGDRIVDEYGYTVPQKGQK